MPFSFNVQIKGTQALLQRFQRAPEAVSGAMQGSVQFTVQKLNRIVKEYIARNLHGKGRLMRSIKPQIGYLRGNVGTDVIYARIHELGGTIRPRLVKYLTIPVNEEYARIRSRVKSLRSLGGFVFVKSKKGQAMLLDKNNNNAPAFILVEMVQIKPKPYMRPAAQLGAAIFRESFAAKMKEKGLD
jgi:phage gpG-like protein